MDWVALVLLWGAALSRVGAARTSLAQRMLWGAFTALAVSRVFSAPPVVAWLDSTTGMEWATLGRHVTGLLSATCLLAYVEVISRAARGSSRARWIWPSLAAAVAFLVVMFTVRGGRIYWVDGATGAGETALSGRLYLLGFDGWLMVCLAAAGWMFASYARVAPGLLRVGLVVSAAAMAAGVVNRAHVLAVNAANLLRPGWGVVEWGLLGRVTFLACVAGIVVGTSIPAWHAVRARARTLGVLRELRPVWAAIVAQYPDIAFRVRGSLDARLARRVLEIRDGMLSLTAAVPPPGDGDPRQVAAWLHRALRAARAGSGSGVPSGRIPGPSGSGIEEETRWLRQVAREFKHTPAEGRVRLVS
ncbi:MAB_1171c family putative transporter [Sinosporangium album]|uniref:MAB_1171c family putative transporter n=1 Tax=Sinosporangium album TaxID=504805 RepID=UPI00115FC86D|nr:MAB_1171c family putative transporter [Sinosporangium album]